MSLLIAAVRLFIRINPAGRFFNVRLIRSTRREKWSFHGLSKSRVESNGISRVIEVAFIYHSLIDRDKCNGGGRGGEAAINISR